MSLAHLAPRSRAALRWHGWLLLTWVMGVGLLSNLILWHGLHIHSMALRYGVGAGAIYFLGFLGGGWLYALWWDRRRDHAPEELAHAQFSEVIDYQQKREAVSNKLSGWSSFTGGGDDPLSILLGVIEILIFVVMLFMLLGYAPYLATEALAGFLAEVALEFVIGAVVVRKILQPRDIRSYWDVMFRKTGIAGVVLITVSALAGWGLQTLNPQASTLFQLF